MRKTIGFIILILLLVPFGLGEARSYEYTDLEISLTIDAQGTIHVMEQRTVRFQGAFTGMYQWIPTTGGIEVRDIRLSEGGADYKRLDQSSPGPAGTFFVRYEPEEVYIDWSFEAVDETRTFRLSYVIDNAIIVHSDTAELYLQFVGKQWEQEHQVVSVELNLPPGASKEEIRAWGHGPLSGTVQIVSGEQVVWKVSPLPAQTFLEGRVTFPPQLVPGASRFSGRDGLSSIIDEETKWAAKSNRLRQLNLWDKILGLVVVVGGIYIAVLYWSKYGKEFTPDFSGEYYRELPAPYPPAELGVLYRKVQTTSADLTATLLDLARKGYLTIAEVSKAEKGRRKKSETADFKFVPSSVDERQMDALNSYEKKLLHFLFEEVGDGEVTLEEIQAFAKKNRRQFAEFWSDWTETVSTAAEEKCFFDKEAAKKLRWLLLPGIGGLVLAVASFVSGMIISGAALVIVGFVLIITGVGFNRRSPQGSTQYAQWKGFRKFLQDFSQLEHYTVPSLIVWEHYLVYAVTLGVAEKVMQQLEIVFPNFEDDGYVFGYQWYMYHHVGSIHHLSTMPTTMERGFQQSVSTATGQTSSGSGAGGGFSGGGGGGFGGGGGGVR